MQLRLLPESTADASFAKKGYGTLGKKCSGIV
jgi:hypothetical protein